MSDETIQSTYKQHPIPQNVLGVEFKLVGELTLRQFIYVAVAGIIAYLLYSSGAPTFIRYPVSITVALLGLAAAFMPMQNQSFDKWIIHFVTAVTSPTQRVWLKVPTPPDIFFFEYRPIAVVTTPVKDRARLTEYLRHLQQPVEEKELNELDRKELEFMRRLGLEPLRGPAPTNLPPPIKPVYNAHETMRRPTGELNLATEVSYARAPIISMPTLSGYIAPITNTRVGRKLSAAAMVENRIAPVRGEVSLNAPEKPRVFQSSAQVPEPTRQEREEALRKQLEALNQRMAEIKKEKPLARAPILTAYNTAKAGSQLRTRIAGTPAGGTPKIAVPVVPPPPESRLGEIDTRYRATLNAIQNQQSSVAGQIKKAETDLDKMKLYAGEVSTKNVQYSEKFKEQEIRLNQLAREKVEAEEKMKILQSELEKMRAGISASAARGQEFQQRFAPPPAPPRPKIEPLIKDAPNVINGIVKDGHGELLEGAVVIVKDENNEPVRALKTNGLGQFIIATPLSNGRYTVGVSKEKESFDIITVNISGKTLEPIEFVSEVSV